MENVLQVTIKAVSAGVKESIRAIGDSVNTAMGKGKAATAGMNAEVKQTAAIAGAAKSAISGIGAAITGAFNTGKTAVSAFNAEISNSLGGINGLVKGAMSAGTALAAVRIGTGLFEAAADLQALNRAFEAITGSAGGAADEMAFVKNEANRLGLELMSTAMSYKGIAAAAKSSGIPMADARTIFTGVSEAASALGLKTEDASGALYAIGQMMSKGNVAAEELRGQLGERLPVALAIMAKALGVNTRDLDKMMESGELIADEVLPKFGTALSANFGASAAKAISDPLQQLNLFSNAILELKTRVATAGFIEILTQAVQKLTEAAKDPALIAGLSQVVTTIAGAVGKVLELAAAAPTVTVALIGIGAAAPILSAVFTVIQGLYAAVKAVAALEWATNFIAAAQGLDMATIAARGLAGVLGSFAAIAAAWTIGQKIGEWLNSFPAVQQAAQATFAAIGVLMDMAVLKYYQLKKAAMDFFGMDTTTVDQSISNRQRELAVSQKVLDSYKQTTAAVGEMKRYVIEIPPVPKDAQESVKKFAEVVFEGKKYVVDTTKNLDEFKKAATEAYKEAAKEAQGYADKIKAIDEEAAKRNKDIDATILEMQRRQMTDEEKIASIRKEALDLSSKAQKLYAEGVKTNNTEMIQEAKDLKLEAIGVWDEYGKSSDEANEEALKKVKGIKDELSDWDMAEKSIFAKLKDEAEQKMRDIEEMWKNMKLDPVDLKANADQAKNELGEVKRILDSLQDKTITVTVKKVETGGNTGSTTEQSTDGYATGVILPGYGGGDKIRALLEAGEAVIRKERVKEAGVRATAAFNTGRWDIVVSELMRRFGGRAVASAKTLKMRLGGLVGWGGSPVGAVKFSTGGVLTAGQTMVLDQFEKMIEKMNALIRDGSESALSVAETMKSEAETWVKNASSNYLMELELNALNPIVDKLNKIREDAENKDDEIVSSVQSKGGGRNLDRVAIDMRVSGRDYQLDANRDEAMGFVNALRGAKMASGPVFGHFAQPGGAGAR